jgi:ATP-dependent DNA helicase RecG
MKAMDTLALIDRIRKTIELGESQFREFESALEGPPDAKKARDCKKIAKDISETLVGFANADGGELLVGVEDNGQVSGIRAAPDQLAYLLAAPVSGVHSDTPLATPVAVQLELEGKNILYFAVDKSTTGIHQTADGRCLQRNDRETRPVSVSRLQFERQEQMSREYDRQYIEHATVADLDTSLIQNVSRATSHMSPERCLQYLGLADYGIGILRLRRAALLLFAKDISRWHPRCQVRVVRIRGNSVKTGRELNLASDEVETGNILQLLSRAWDRLRPHLVETKLSPDSLFREQVMYPEDACRETLINAITHRDYSIEGQNIEIFIFDDRMEVHSPGALLSTVNLADLKRLSGVHESRNALIARVLREVGYVREMGEGMRRIFRLFSDADLVPPDVISIGNRFSFVLHYRSVFTSEDQHWLAGFKRLSLTREEMLVALMGKDGQLIAPQQIYDRLGLVDWDIYRELIEQLYAKGVLYNTMSEAKKNTLAKGNGRSKRDIARLAVRQPEDVEKGLSDFYALLARFSPTQVADGTWVKALNDYIPASNPYHSSQIQMFRLLRILNLLDESNRPTTLLQTLWTAAPSTAVPLKTVAYAKPVVPLPRTTAREAQITQAKGPSDGRTGAPLEIYVGNLAYDITEQQLFHHFQQCGQVLNVRIPRDLVTGQGRGFAFVKMIDREVAMRAVQELDNSSLRDRKIRIGWAR